MFSFLRRLYWRFFIPTPQLTDGQIEIIIKQARLTAEHTAPIFKLVEVSKKGERSMIEIDDRVTIRDEHDAIAAARGYDPACYEDIKVRRYTVETATFGFSFSVDEKGGIVRLVKPKPLVEGVDIA